MKFNTILCATAPAFLVAALAMAAQPGKAADSAIKVNGVTIPSSRVDLLVKAATAQGQPDTPELRNRIREILIEREVVAQEAAKKGLDKTPDFATQLELQKQQMLGQAYFQDYFKSHPVTEDTLKKEYESAKTRMGPREVKVRHILVKDENDAKQIVAQLKKGGSFEKVAAEKSVDTGNKDNGGDLGWVNPNTVNMVPPFVEALKKMKKGQLSDPVQTQYGWHVIRMDDERPTTAPPYDEVKATMAQQLQQQQAQKVVSDLRAKAKVE